MSKTIHISDDLYHRIEAHASKFDTPADVIERVLNAYEKIPSKPASQGDPSAHEGLSTTSTTDTLEQDTNIRLATSLDIVYISGSKEVSEEEFKQELLKSKRAYIKLYHTNGKTECKEWSALNFRPTSGISNNLRSGYLRKWRQRGIYKAILSVNLDDLAADCA